MKRKNVFLVLLCTVLLCCAVLFSACDDGDAGETDEVGGQETSGGAATSGGQPDTFGDAYDTSGDPGENDSRPGESESDPASSGTVSEGESTEPHTCAGDTWVTVKEATCKETGEEQRKCATCQAVLETRTLEKKAHVKVHHEGLAADCMGDGYKPYDTCENCDYSSTYEAIEALGHDLETYAAKAPTCKAAGHSAYKSCKREGCDYKDSYVELQMVDHSYGDDRLCVWCQKEYGGQPLSYTSNGDGTCTLTGLGTCTDMQIEIPKKAMSGDLVTAVGAGAFSGKEIASLSFAEDSCVTAIGKGAFENCKSLETVTLPVSLETIGENAFLGCERLWSCTVPTNGSLKTVGKSAFKNCVILASFTLPASAESIGESAFFGCRQLVEVYDLSTHINVQKVTDISNGSIGYYVISIRTDADTASGVWVNENGFRFFENGDDCYLLGVRSAGSVLTLPKNCNGKNYAIHPYAFYKHEGLTKVSLTAQVKSIGDYAFAYCNQLSAVDVVLRGNLARIGEGAFSNCGALTSFRLPSSLTYIGENAFLKCYHLVEVHDLTTHIPVEKGNVTEHGGVGAYVISLITDTAEASRIHMTADGYVFYAENHTKYLVGYVGTKTILTLPDSYKVNAEDTGDGSYSISKYAFYGNDALRAVTFGEKTTGIGEYAFAGCTALESVVLTEALCRIDANAFLGCESLSQATFPMIKGWRCVANAADGFGGVTLSSTALDNAGEAAKYLRETYVLRYWRYAEPDSEWSGWY